MLRLLELLGIP